MPNSKLDLTGPAARIITLLNNAEELIVRSNNRQGAKDVVRAMVIYANGKSFPIPDEKIDTFYAVLIDSRPYTLSAILKDIATDVLVRDKAIRAQRNKNKRVRSIRDD